MSKILILAEQMSGTLQNNIKRSTLELVSVAQDAAAEITVLCMGEGATAGAEQLKSLALHSVLVYTKPDADKYNPEVYTQILAQAISQSKAEIVLGAASSLGKDLFPRVAAQLKVSILSDATSLDLKSNPVKVMRPVYSGKALASQSIEGPGPQIILMRANQLPINTKSGTAPVSALNVNVSGILSQVVEIVKGTSQRLDLTEANIIVSGGRGLKEASNFKLIEDLADALGASVGASRAIVDSGWVSHSLQVGQTGKTVAPTLYIAIGISGAIQHLAGMSASRVIVAINSDANAPIFQKATYGIVGDLFQIVPALTAEFKRVLKE